jgi:glutamate racemase
MHINQLPIGVFDSGMGGLTVLRALKAILPNESFIYLGDTARLPYGTKSSDTVQQYALQMVRILIRYQIKALVVACNTATTAALPHLQAMFSDILVLGVVEPSAKAIVAATKNQHVTVFATETTIASGAYQQLIKAQLPNAVINTRACSILVALAEEGMVNNAITHAALIHYLSEVSSEDTILLGCTHFPVFKPLLATLLPAHVTIIDSAEVTAYALQQQLLKQNLAITLSVASPKCQIRYLVTDSVKRFKQVGEVFLGESLAAQSVELIDACY